MENFTTALVTENEIFKAADFTFGYDSIMANVARALASVLAGGQGNYVVGGNVSEFSSGGLNVSIAPLFAFCQSSKVAVVEGDVTEPISFEEADSALDRIDIIEIRGKEIGYDSQSRKFYDPATDTYPVQTVNTKKRIALEVVVKKGSNGSNAAPPVDSGFIKLAEVIIPAGTNNITEEMIKNISARKYGVDNTEWTANKSATFNPSYLANVLQTFLQNHNEDGSHKNASIKAANIDFGTASTQVKGSIIPTGQSMSIHGADFSSSDSISALLLSLANNANNLYKYSNDILSRFSFLSDFPFACSTENVDIATGGEMTIDGAACTIGQMVLLKDQTNKKENGFWEVQSGAWNRYAGYTATDSDCFVHKFICVKNGTANKGKIYYLNSDFAQIGTDELEFTESNFTPFAQNNKFIVRDENGRAKVAEPAESDDISTKNYVDVIDSRYLFTHNKILSAVSRFLRFSAENKKALKIVAGTQILVGTHLFYSENDTTFDLSAQTFEAGKDYYVYLEWATGDVWSLRASKTKTADTDTSRRIGRFHTLCISIPSNTTMKMSVSNTVQGDSILIKPYTDDDSDFKAFYTKTVTTLTAGTKASGIVQGPFYAIATCAHPLAGFSAGDILPESVWCLTFKPNARFDDAMVYDKATDKAIDVYLQSGAGANTRSAYGATHTVGQPQIVHQDDFLQVGKEMLSDTEFTSAAIGSNEGTNIQGSSDKTTVGGHTDTAGRRMISAIGCEEMCGYLWQWCRDVAPLGTGTAWANIDDTNGHNVGNSGWISEDGQNDFGEMYNAIVGLRSGGNWHYGANCGSRSRHAADARSLCSANIGSRASSRVVMR